MNMLNRLRRNLTLLCAVSTGIILAVNSVVSLLISDAQLTERGQALFQNSVSTISLRVSGDSVLEWEWIAVTERENGIAIHIEDNGKPFLYPGTWPAAGRAQLLAEVQQVAAQQHGVDASVRPRSTLTTDRAEFVFVAGNGEQYRAAVTVFRTVTGFRSVTVLGDTTAERLSIWRQRWIYMGLVLLSTIGLVLFSWWFSGRAVRPVAANRQRQTEFIAAASHELRTPLAVIQTSAAALREVEGRQEREFVAAIERECTRTGKLVDDLLVLANADANTWSMEIGPVELEQVLEECAGAFQATANQKQISLVYRKPPRPLPLVAGDSHRMGQLISILLDNACRYTPQGGTIVISADASARHLQVRVADTGPGIPDELREQVFERFFRADAARSKKEHYGLGLSIAWEIAALHKGKLSLSDTPGGGLTVTLRLPIL